MTSVASDEEQADLYYCIEDNDIDTLSRLLKYAGYSQNTVFTGTNQLRKSVLHLCCEKGRYECAKVLLEHRAWPGVKDEWYQTPLMYAVNTGRDDMVGLMLKQKRCDKDTGDRYGMTALHFAAKCGFCESLDLLIQAGCNLNIGDCIGRTPLWVAASVKDDRVEVMQKLIEAGCSVNQQDEKQLRGPLHVAVVNRGPNRVKNVKLLLENGADPNHVDIFKLTSMMLLLKKATAPVDGSVPPLSPMDVEIAKLLLDHGYDTELSTSGRRRFEHTGSALTFAIEFECFPIMELLLDYGTDTNKRDQKGLSPIFKTIANERIKALKYLVAANCDLEIKAEVTLNDKQHTVTPFLYALLLEKLHICEMLVKCGYDLSGEEYLWTNVDVPTHLVLNLDLWNWLLAITRSPKSLKQLCTVSIRTFLNERIHRKVKELALPPGLQDLLLLK